MENTKRNIHCSNCGASLAVENNRARVFCPYCGKQNTVDADPMTLDLNMGSVNVKAKTELPSMKNAARYAIENGYYPKADELIMACLMSGEDDYELIILEIMMSLCKDRHAGAIFRCLERLRKSEQSSSSPKMAQDIKDLMSFRNPSGMQLLHYAANNERMDMVIFCVEHGSNVNAVAGKDKVTPVSIMFEKLSDDAVKWDGTPFVHNRKKVKEIRRYLMSHGAKDRFRLGY